MPEDWINKLLHNSTFTTIQITDHRWRVEISAVCEMQKRGEISIDCVNKEQQLADYLTKKGATRGSIASVLQKEVLITD